MSETQKHRFLEALGYGGWDSDIDLAQVHVSRAETENLKDAYKINEFDDHELHADAHVKYLLSECPTGKKAERLKAHIKEHRAAIALTAAPEQSTAPAARQSTATA